MRPMTPEWFDLSGGLNDTTNPAQIADNQAAICENFIPYAARLRRRNGTFRKTYAAYSLPLTGLGFYRTPTGGIGVIFGTPQGFARFGDADISIILNVPYAPTSTSLGEMPVIDYNLLPWVFVPVGGAVYAMRRGANTILRVTRTEWMRSGIRPPTAAPSVSVNNDGVMTAGEREVVYTFRNSLTGSESDYSPASDTITLNDDDSIDVDDIAVSPNPQVNQRRLYVNAPGTAGVYLLALEINDNTTTSANINAAVRDLGAIASVRNGLPPADPAVGDLFLDSYLVVSDGVDVFVSEALKPEQFWPTNRFDVFKNDGHAVRAIRAMGDRVYIGKTNKVHYFTKIGSVWQRGTLTEDHGCPAHHSMQVADGRLVWFTGTDFVQSDGYGATPIATPRIKRLLSRIPANRYEYVTAAVYPAKGLYVAEVYLAPDSEDIQNGAAPTSDPAEPGNNTSLIFNYRTGAWAVGTYNEALGAPNIVAHGWNEVLQPGLYATTMDSHFYQMDRGTTDAGYPIVARWRSKAFRFGPLGNLSWIRRVFLKISTVAAAITLRLYRDDETAAAKEREDMALDELSWPRDSDVKGFNMHSEGKGGVWQLEVEYSGEPPIDIEAAAFEAVPMAMRVRMR